MWNYTLDDIGCVNTTRMLAFMLMSVSCMGNTSKCYLIEVELFIIIYHFQCYITLIVKVFTGVILNHCTFIYADCINKWLYKIIDFVHWPRGSCRAWYNCNATSVTYVIIPWASLDKYLPIGVFFACLSTSFQHNGWMKWWWWYHSLTAHQHQKGHTVPKQVIMIATSIQVTTV